MKHLLTYIIGVGLLVTACDIERSDNGRLDGFWQLSSVDSLSTGSSTDLREKQVTWGFQGSLLETRIANSPRDSDDVVLRFNHTGDVLRLSEPYIVNRDSGDKKVNQPAVLYQFGISRLGESFKVLRLTNDNMDLESEVLRLHFRKY